MKWALETEFLLKVTEAWTELLTELFFSDKKYVKLLTLNLEQNHFDNKNKLGL